MKNKTIVATATDAVATAAVTAAFAVIVPAHLVRMKIAEKKTRKAALAR